MIPVHREVKNLITKDKYIKGNFGLWFYKFVSLDGNTLKSGDNDVNDYKDQYENLCNNKFLDKLIENKHINQIAFYKSKESTHKTLVYKATLISPLVTGIGNTHPCEVGMTFDHNLGIPYIPASSIKGIVRFAHTLDLIENNFDKVSTEAEKNGKDEFNDEEDWTNIPAMFGKGGDNGNRGNVIFLDAYPEKIPNLRVDIMNPHYSPYYTEGKPPADYHNPIPIKFLTVAKETTFIFRVLIDKKKSDIEQEVSSAIKNSLEREGVGAKTAVGYGRFKIESNDEPQNLIDAYEKKFLTEEEKIKRKVSNFIDRIQNTNDNDTINSLFDEWQKDDKISNNKEIAKAFEKKVKKTKANGEFTANYKRVAEILDISLEESESVDKNKNENTARLTDNDIENELKKALKKIKKANGNKKKIRGILKDYKKIKDKILKECPYLNELLQDE